MKKIKWLIEINRRSFLAKAELGTATTVIWPFFLPAKAKLLEQQSPNLTRIFSLRKS